MYVQSSLQCENFPEPNVISSSGLYDYVGRFAYTGTRDYTAYASIFDAMQYCESYIGGFQKMMEYNHTLVVEVGRRLVAAWGNSNKSQLVLNLVSIDV